MVRNSIWLERIQMGQRTDRVGFSSRSREHLILCHWLISLQWVSCVGGWITAGHVGHFSQFLHDVVQSRLSVVHLLTEVIQNPAGDTIQAPQWSTKN